MNRHKARIGVLPENPLFDAGRARSGLLTSPMAETLRELARRIFRAGVQAADPARAVLASLERAPLPEFEGKLYVVALGKGAVAMAGAALQRLTPARTIVVTNYENEAPVPGATVFAAGHPVPDINGQKAGAVVSALLNGAGAGDHVLALISGGGSALLPAPVAGVTLKEKAEVNRLLLGAGMEISEMNLVRQQLSTLKGGGFLRMAARAQVTALILSDVVGDDLAVVASGPTVAPIGDHRRACAALKAGGVWEQLPGSVREALMGAEKPVTEMGQVDNRLVGSNAKSVAAMATVAPEAQVFPHALDGDVEDAARRVCACKGAGIWLFGGETTVRLRGTGLGGRNQELALRVALEAERLGWGGDWVFLSGGTDGRDGPTDAAGGLVDQGTLARMRANGVDPAQILANNDSYHGLLAADDLLIVGATGTNVADLQVLIRP